MIQVPEVKLQFMNQAYYETFIGLLFFYQSKNYVTVTRKIIEFKKKMKLHFWARCYPAMSVVLYRSPVLFLESDLFDV